MIIACYIRLASQGLNFSGLFAMGELVEKCEFDQYLFSRMGIKCSLLLEK